MKKFIYLFLLLSISLFGCLSKESTSEVQSDKEQSPVKTSESVEKLVVTLVEKFGSKLQNVSLLGPQTELEKSMKENYGGIVSPELIKKWLKDPKNAPGRLTSSPWPDRIDITNIQRQSDQKYSVKGEIVEVTSTGVADKRPIQLFVEKVGKQWMITSVKITQAEKGDSIVYANDKYGFRFKLPVSWKNYSIVEDVWVGEKNGKVIEKGPILTIRHPEWTSGHPRQDIPIMIFTIKQWESMQADKFHIGAAPVGPKELARNKKFVFALPARYNFAFLPGYEEVEKIVESNPIEVQF